MEKPESLIGRKIKGFKFEGSEFPDIGYDSDFMDKYEDEIGVIQKFMSKNYSFAVFFKDGFEFEYPANLIEQHLIPEETDSPDKPMTAEEVADKYLTPLGGSKLHRPYYILAMQEYHSQQSRSESEKAIKTMLDQADEIKDLKRKVEQLNADKYRDNKELLELPQEYVSTIQELKKEKKDILNNWTQSLNLHKKRETEFKLVLAAEKEKAKELTEITNNQRETLVALQLQYGDSQAALTTEKEKSAKLVEALIEVNQFCGSVNFSSHNQMREAIEFSVFRSEEALKNY